MKKWEHVAALVTISLTIGCEQNGKDVGITPSAPTNPAAINHQTGELTEVETYSAALSAPPAEYVGKSAETAKRMSGTVAAVDERKAVPTVYLAGKSKDVSQSTKDFDGPAEAAKAYLDDHCDLYNLSPEAAKTAQVADVYKAKKGTTVVRLKQSVDGIEVYDTQMAMMLNDKQQLVAITGNLHPEGRVGASRTDDVRISERDAIAKAYADVVGQALPVDNLKVAQDDGAKGQAFALRPGVGVADFVFAQPTSVTAVLYPMPKKLIRAYQIEMELAPVDVPTSRAYEYVVSASNGAILERRNLTVAHSYNVWADKDGELRPFDGPHGDSTPHPTSNPLDTVAMPLVDRNLIEIDGFNTNPEGRNDPWLPEGTQITTGNNVDAYADHNAPDGFSDGDLRAKTSSPGIFDWEFNGDEQPNEEDTQIMASVTQIFYVTNWLHDYYYDSGFNEAAGNAQKDNFNRGGEGGDPLLIEAQDTNGENRNNANMSTPGDGRSPRMQMYLWDGEITPVGETKLEITAPETLAGTYEAQGATFGVDDLVTASGSLVLAEDEGGEAGVKGDGCEEFVTDVTDKVAMVDRGACPFVQKAENARDAGAAAIIIVNNDEVEKDALPPLGGDETTLELPVVGVSFNTGEKFKAAIAALGQAEEEGEEETIDTDVTRAGRKRGPMRDGTLDNSIVAHEWGHYFHHRLSICGGTVQCGGMSEGWGDYIALAMHLREGDNLDGAFADAAYSVGDAFFGIRRVAYSVDFAINPLTFRHVGIDAVLPADKAPIRVGGSNTEVHNAGEIWATALWEVHIALTKESQGDNPRYSFKESQRRIADYIVAGLLAAPPNATMLEMRDSLLAAAAASDPIDLRVMAEAFARRGFGTGAVAPDRASIELEGIVESFRIGGELRVANILVSPDIDCDKDENLDAGETATITVEVLNSGPIALTDTTVTIKDINGVTFPNGASATIDELAPLGRELVRIEIQLDRELSGIQELEIQATSTNKGAVRESVESAVVKRANYDNLSNKSALDDVESDLSPWEAKTEIAQGPEWSRVQRDAPNMVWFAEDIGERGDQALESPSLKVGAESFSVTFDHRHQFESSAQQNPETGEIEITHWDGGVIEFSVDGGNSWKDVLELGIDPGYRGLLTVDGENPIGGRPALVFQNPDWPEMTSTTLDFGTQLADKNVKIRFRLGTDVAAGDIGWELDNLNFEGIENTPFATIGEQAGECRDGEVPGPGNSGDIESGGCGCQSADLGASWPVALGFLFSFLALRRRREPEEA